MTTRTADEWEEFLQARHVPAARVRTMGEAIADPQIASRGVIHRHANGGNGVEGAFGVPLAAFKFAHGGPRIDSAPPTLGQHNDEILDELGLGRRRRSARRLRIRIVPVATHSLVTPGLDPGAIFLAKGWMAGSSPAMTISESVHAESSISPGTARRAYRSTKRTAFVSAAASGGSFR